MYDAEWSWRRVTSYAFILLVLVGLALTTPETAMGDDVVEPDAPPELNDADPAIVVQTPEEAAAMDEALARSQGGFDSPAMSAQHLDMSAGLGAVQEQLFAQASDVYAGATLPANPAHPATVYIKGAADPLVERIVADASIDIRIVDRMQHSWYELEELSIQLSDHLVALGYQNMSTSFDETTGVVEATITLQAGLPITSAELRPELPAALRDADVSFIDRYPQGTHAFGGMRTRSSRDGTVCTTGWSVSNGSATGVSTAGHCDSQDSVRSPVMVNEMTLNHKAEHRGEWGDIEWKTTPHLEPKRFYADATIVRDVLAVEPRSTLSVRETVCVYGRASNSRNCGTQILRTSSSCTFGGTTHLRLVAMDAQVGALGDSGGGWSWNNTAYGSQTGWCSVDGRCCYNHWSVADLFDEALGVHVREVQER